MAFNNEMTKLLNKIERRLGTRLLNLPTENPDMSKTYWPTVIEEDTLPTFSRFYPRKFKYQLTPNCAKKDGFYLIDEALIENVKIIGVKDVDWQSFSVDPLINQSSQGMGYYIGSMNSYAVEDIALAQMQLDHMSLFNQGFFVEFEPPNKIRIKNSMGADIGMLMRSFYLDLFIEHKDLLSIEPTKMETFEKLAIADVATFLYGELKYYDGIETVFAGTDMKLDDIRTKADTRQEVIEYLEANYVSASNANQPSIICQ